MNKYVCSTERFSNCRVHDGGFSSGLRFFGSFSDVLKSALKEINDVEFGNIYSIESGDVVGEMSYQYASHHCIGMSVKFEGQTYKTTDNGHGELGWNEGLPSCDVCNGDGHVKPRFMSTAHAIFPVSRCGTCGQTYDQLERHVCTGMPKCHDCDGSGLK